MTESREYEVQALTDIWTGSVRIKEVNGEVKEKPEGDRLATTSLLGSIRWWFEVLVRGLGGLACDPSAENGRCPDSRVKDSTKPGHHCIVCELFGCTAWARKFRFDVLAEDSQEVQTNQIKKGTRFILRFTPLRPIQGEEWVLLDLTLRLISGYGAIGGKTVYKPSSEPGREKAVHHQDYGLVEIMRQPSPTPVTIEALEGYVRKGSWRAVDHNEYVWASLRHFWSVKGRYLCRKSTTESGYNRVLGRVEDKTCIEKDRRGLCIKRKSDHLSDPSDSVACWLAGRQQESKKVFSFKNPGRTFGFVKPDTVSYEQMEDRLRQVWTGLKDDDFLRGAQILEKLMG